MKKQRVNRQRPLAPLCVKDEYFVEACSRAAPCPKWLPLRLTAFVDMLRLFLGMTRGTGPAVLPKASAPLAEQHAPLNGRPRAPRSSREESAPLRALSLESGYFFFLQVQSFAGLPHPEQTPFLISAPQTLHGAHPQTWHIRCSFPGQRLSTNTPLPNDLSAVAFRVPRDYPFVVSVTGRPPDLFQKIPFPVRYAAPRGRAVIYARIWPF